MIRKLSFAMLLLLGLMINAQANRFFYELTYKPKKDSSKIEKATMILDINKEKSIYQDYVLVVQDSLLNQVMEEMKKSGVMFDQKKLSNQKPPKFSHRISKSYPSMEISYKEQIAMDYFLYKETPKFNWKIENEKSKIGAYEVQKASTEYAGRKWTAWFSSDIPFQDGPYKFYGLPGLIVKVEDEAKDYSWVLKGNRKIDNLADHLYSESLLKMSGKSNTVEVSKEKFAKRYEEYKQDPFASMREMLSQIPKDMKTPDGSTVAEKMREQEKKLKDYLQAHDNNIEMPEAKKK